MTAFLLAPVSRVTARIELPSQRRWRIFARSSGVNLFIGTLMLENSAGVNTVFALNVANSALVCDKRL